MTFAYEFSTELSTTLTRMDRDRRSLRKRLAQVTDAWKPSPSCFARPSLRYPLSELHLWAGEERST
ncbi:hypothetical protein PsYK624_150550 [Phanerochaete sordida]|uniref:Uncharacterized protein n=1 Tax=Phanerochaete sordida TaxID=48140 RepID=A0A9P3LKP4_9APHY|nr:hypothetical protein PsYK624_150550 [Phanerochaete sordida]